jgi:hypothetical protein
VRNEAEGLLEGDHTVARGRDAARAAAIGADCERAETGGNCDRRTATRSARGTALVPGVGGAPEERRLGETFMAEFGGRRLADQDAASPLQPRHRHRIRRRHIVDECHRTKSRPHPDGIDKVLDRERHAKERP